jgi:hypothetical protein
MAGVHARDLVDAAFTADFTGFRLTCTPPLSEVFGVSKVLTGVMR